MRYRSATPVKTDLDVGGDGEIPCRSGGDLRRFTPDASGARAQDECIKDATVKRYHYASHDELRQHLQLFIDAYNYGRRLETLRGLTPYEFIVQAWTKQPQRFRLDPSHHMLVL